MEGYAAGGESWKHIEKIMMDEFFISGFSFIRIYLHMTPVFGDLFMIKVFEIVKNSWKNSILTVE